MKSILGACGIADLSGDPVHVLIVGETDAGRLLVQRVGCQEPVTVIDRTAFVEDLAIVPEQLSDQVRQAALDLGQAIERAKALAGSDRLLQQEDFQILHDKLDDMDRYPFASALIEHGVHVRTGAVDILTDPHDEGDSLGKHPEPWASPGSEGEARGVGQDPQDAPGSFPWTPADAGDGISNESATSEMDYPWVRKVEGEAAWDTALLPQIDKAIEEGGGWANMKRLPGGETVIWDMIDRGILEEEGGFVRRKQPEDEHEAEMGWSGTELTTNERWAQDNETIASVSMMDLAKHPLGRPKHDLEKDSDANTPSGRDRGLNPSVHEEIGEAYRDQNQWEDPDMHLGAPSRRSYIATASMRDLIAMEGTPYQTNVPIAEGEGEGVHDEVDLEEVNIQPHASRTAEFRTPTSVEDCKRAIQRAEKAKRKAEAELTDARSAGYEIGIRMWEERVAEYDAAIAHFERWMTEHGHEAQLDDSIGIAGDNFEDEGTGEALDPEDDVPVPKDFGLMASMSMRQLIAMLLTCQSCGHMGDHQDFGIRGKWRPGKKIQCPACGGSSVSMVDGEDHEAQGVDNRMMSEDVFTDPLEDTEDKAIPRPPEDEPVRYQRAPGPA